MYWKKWPYWVRGVIVGVPSSIVLFYFLGYFNEGFIFEPGFIIKQQIPGLMSSCEGLGCIGEILLYFVIYSSIIGALTGFLIGNLYGKIKNNKLGLITDEKFTEPKRYLKIISIISVVVLVIMIGYLLKTLGTLSKQTLPLYPPYEAVPKQTPSLTPAFTQ